MNTYQSLRGHHGAFVAILLLAASIPCKAQIVAPDFAADYSATSLGSISGVGTNYGGLTFKAGDPNTLLIGGFANGSAGVIYEVEVLRDAESHITGFNGPAIVFASSPYIDGGLTYGPAISNVSVATPGSVLFSANFPTNTIDQFKSGSVVSDKQIDLASVGVASTTGAIVFVPDGFAGAGRAKILSYGGSNWYDTTVTPDGSGTYDINPVGPAIFVGGGPEGAIYVSGANPVFDTDSILIAAYGLGKVFAYDSDSNGDPIVATQRDFITGLNGAEGATVDPLTGDFLFSTFGGSNQIVAVRGFTVPEPTTGLLALFGVAIFAGSRRRDR